MFEDFSFSSPSSNRPPRLAVDGDDNVMVDCDSTLISPLSSRCPSPKSSQRRPRNHSRSRSSYLRSPPPTSVPFSYDQKRLSIATLTKKLHEHTLQNPNGEEHQDDLPTSPHSPSDSALESQFQGCFLTPPDTDHDESAEGYFDSVSLASGSLSPPSQSPFLSPTSMPSDFTMMDRNTDGAGGQDPINVRAQRQHIVSRLQCNQTGVEAIRRALLSEDCNSESDSFGEVDCHPSSLPPQASPRRRAVTFNRSRFGTGTDTSPERRGRRKSSSGPPSHRIDKPYQQSHRDIRKKSEQGLRRKSLVSAALASMAERSPHSAL